MTKTNRRLIMAIIISTLFMAIGYAEVTNTQLSIAGEIEATAQTGVYITEATTSSEVSTINYYTGTMLDTKTVLGTTSTSTVSYNVTLYNNSEKDYVFIGVLTDKEDEYLYSNTNINYTLTGLTEYETTISPKQSLTFTITFKYAGTDVSNNTLESKLNFRFREKPEISLSNEGEEYILENIYPGYIPQEYKFKVNNTNAETGKTNNVPMEYTFETTTEEPIEAKIYEGTTEITGSVALEGEKEYTLKIIWDESKNSTEYSNKEYSCKVVLKAKPTNSDYAEYEINKEFNIKITVCKHIWVDGVCTICGTSCTHSYVDGICTICGTSTGTCVHNWIDGTCTICGEQQITADIIAAAEDKTEYYGRTVNYTCGDSNVGWKIFYAGKTPGGTENNIYLIADDCIAWDNIGTTLQGLLYKNDEYTNRASFNNVISNQDYLKGTESNRFINSPAKNWLKFARDTNIDNGYGEISSEESMRTTAMMLDTTVWKNYCNPTYASYATGGSTLDMMVESWNQTQTEKIYYKSEGNGYLYMDSPDATEGKVETTVDTSNVVNVNYLYFKVGLEDYFLASPLSSESELLYGELSTTVQFAITNEAGLVDIYFSKAESKSTLYGFRPVICLYSDIKLTTNDNMRGDCDFGFTGLCEHEFVDGICSKCKRNCVHSYNEDGICEICGIECEHNYLNDECTICQKTCEHDFVDDVCTICGTIDCVHSWSDGTCTICGTICNHRWEDETCTKCGLVCSHNWDGGGNQICYTCGYHCTHVYQNNKCTKCGHTSCIVEGTLITLADGQMVPVEELTGEEKLLVWDMQTGSYEEAEIGYIVNHDNIVSERKIMNLYFSDGTEIEIVTDHGFYDIDKNKIIYINEKNYEEYIGDWFVTQKLGTENERNKAQLTEVKIEYREARVYEVVTYQHLTCFTNGLLSISSLLNPFCNIFEVDSNTLSYDKELMEKDIEEYGLFTYDDFKDLIPEYVFDLYHVDYLKVALGKGYTTWDEIYFLVDYYHKEIARLINAKW